MSSCREVIDEREKKSGNSEFGRTYEYGDM
jgi:hypothetical protein